MAVRSSISHEAAGRSLPVRVGLATLARGCAVIVVGTLAGYGSKIRQLTDVCSLHLAALFSVKLTPAPGIPAWGLPEEQPFTVADACRSQLNPASQGNR